MQQNHCLRLAIWQDWLAIIERAHAMQRDDDLWREILLEWESSSDWVHISYTTQSSTDDEMRRHFHVLLMQGGGLIEPMKVGGNGYRITGAGHDFLAETRENASWEAVKTAAKALGGVGVGVMAQIATAMVMQKARAMGILP